MLGHLDSADRSGIVDERGDERFDRCCIIGQTTAVGGEKFNRQISIGVEHGVSLEDISQGRLPRYHSLFDQDRDDSGRHGFAIGADGVYVVHRGIDIGVDLAGADDCTFEVWSHARTE